MNTITLAKVMKLWESWVLGLAVFIGVSVMAACTYLFLTPTDASGSPDVPCPMCVHEHHGAAGPEIQDQDRDAALPTVTVKLVADREFGKIVVDGNGYALYRMDTDPPNMSTCTRRCLEMWQPATVNGEPVAGAGIDASKLSTIAGAFGAQITYAGHPLYRYIEDRAPADRSGQGVFEVWWLVGRHGQEVTAPVAHTSKSHQARAGY